MFQQNYNEEQIIFSNSCLMKEVLRLGILLWEYILPYLDVLTSLLLCNLQRAKLYNIHIVSFRLSLDCIGKNAVLLEKQLPWLPSRLLEEVVEKITFWVAVNHRQKKQAKAEEHEQINVL